MNHTAAAESRWIARVETFVPGDSQQYLPPAVDALRDLLGSTDPEARDSCGGDQGTGLAEPVVGLCFLVTASGPGAAADRAVELATAALGESARDLYGVSVVRQEAAPLVRDPSFPSLND